MAVLDVLGKVVLAGFLLAVLVDPSWGNLEGKAPTARALTYPMLAFAVPVWWHAYRPARPYPWLADLLLTYTAFSDVLGNRVDLYDTVAWFDEWMHVTNVACVAAALVLLTLPSTSSGWAVLAGSVALGMTAALAWELFEYVAFVTRSPEMPTAYGDTLGDLLMGWCGTVLAAALVHHAWRHHLTASPEISAQAQARLAR
ncbi:hypothetical protein ASG94_11310 [Nocardioides sp. Soil805]|nr:hypothetical protein ASG94_11310 [Nocardioides sp. Soil805]